MFIAAPHSRGLDSISTSPQWQSTCCNLSGLARPLLTQCPSTPSPLLTQQWRRAAKKINNDWQALGGRVIGETARIIASNTARIYLSIWLRSQQYLIHYPAVDPNWCVECAYSMWQTDRQTDRGRQRDRQTDLKLLISHQVERLSYLADSARTFRCTWTIPTLTTFLGVILLSDHQ